MNDPFGIIAPANVQGKNLPFDPHPLQTNGMNLCGVFLNGEDPENAMITLRVSGLGHSSTFGLISSASVGELKKRIEQDYRLPVEYQRLLARGTKLEDDEISLADVGIEDRTKIMVMHNDLYAKEKETFEALSRIDKEIRDLTEQRATTQPAVVRELVTRICLRLDEVQVKGSETLRARRKVLLTRAEALDNNGE